MDGADGALSGGGGDHEAPTLVFWSLPEQTHTHTYTHTHTCTEASGREWEGGRYPGWLLAQLGSC